MKLVCFRSVRSRAPAPPAGYTGNCPGGLTFFISGGIRGLGQKPPGNHWVSLACKCRGRRGLSPNSSPPCIALRPQALNNDAWCSETNNRTWFFLQFSNPSSFLFFFLYQKTRFIFRIVCFSFVSWLVYLLKGSDVHLEKLGKIPQIRNLKILN